MIIEQRKKWNEGKELWFEYVKTNGYSFTCDNEGLQKLSNFLDLNKKYISERINLYLLN